MGFALTFWTCLRPSTRLIFNATRHSLSEKEVPMRGRLTMILAIVGALIATNCLRAVEAVHGDADMMHRYLLGLAEQAAQKWQADYEARTTPEQVEAYQKQSRGRLVEALGGWPERAPLNAQVVGRIQRDGFAVEKVIFESQPHFHVTALLFLPDPARFKPPYPGVVEPCGHSTNGKAHKTYQTMAALLALNGMATLVFDPVEQGERLQAGWDRGPDAPAGDPASMHGVHGHQFIGIGSIPLGRAVARVMIWDTMRGIDYLQSRPEIDPQRIGCVGNSGGGILTAYMVALDDRVQAAAPSCYLNNLAVNLRTIGPEDAEHHWFAALTVGPQNTDLLMLRAPVPTLLCEGTKDYFDIGGSWQMIRCAKRLYTRLGFAERVDIIENDAPHGYTRLLREATARWMSRWLLHKEQPITEPPIEVLTDQEAQCTPDGQVMKLPGARSAYDLNGDYERELARRRQELWAKSDRAPLLEQVRQIAGIRRLDQLPPPQVEKGETTQRSGYRIQQLALRPEDGIVLPASLFVPEKSPSGRVVLYVHEKGNETDAGPGGRIEQLVLGGARVLAVEPRGTGRSQHTKLKGFGPQVGTDWQDVTAAYLLGRSYVGMRAEDILIAARYATQTLGGASVNTVDLVAVGHVGVPALHAAALEPALFDSVKLSQTLVAWAIVVKSHASYGQQVNVVHGALRVYDLPNLAATLGSKLAVEEPLDAMGK